MRNSWRKSETRKVWSMKQGIRDQKFVSRHWWISVISRIRIWSLNIKSTKAELYSGVTLWKMMQDHTQYSLNKDHQHLKWRPQKSWTSYPDCQDVQDKQLMQYPPIPRSKWKMHRRYQKFQNRNVQTIGFVYHDTNGLNSGPVSKTQSFLLKEICTVILWQDCCGKGNLRKSYWNMAGRKFQIVNVCSLTEKKDMWTIKNWHARSRTSSRLGKYKWKTLIWKNQHHLLTTFILVAPKESVKSARTMWTISRACSNPESLLELQKSYQVQGNLKQTNISSWSYDVERSCEEMRGKILRVFE